MGRVRKEREKDFEFSEKKSAYLFSVSSGIAVQKVAQSS